MEEIGLFDEVKIVKNPLISDEQQMKKSAFAEAQEAWCAAACRAADSPSIPNGPFQRTEAEVTLVNRFMAGGSKNPLMRRAWSAYFL